MQATSSQDSSLCDVLESVGTTFNAHLGKYGLEKSSHRKLYASHDSLTNLSMDLERLSIPPQKALLTVTASQIATSPQTSTQEVSTPETTRHKVSASDDHADSCALQEVETINANAKSSQIQKSIAKVSQY